MSPATVTLCISFLTEDAKLFSDYSLALVRRSSFRPVAQILSLNPDPFRLEEQLSPANNKDVFTTDFGCDLYWRAEGKRLTVLPKGTAIVAKQIQRFLLENILRERVLQTQNIEVMDGKNLIKGGISIEY